MAEVVTAEVEESGLEAMTTVDELLLAAQLPVTVLVTAESREERMSCARFIHDSSAHSRGPFVTARGPDDPNPAIEAGEVAGWFEQASGGTLFIDDINGLSGPGQEQLFLRLEQNALGRRRQDSAADGHVRVIAGASRTLLVDIAAGAFCARLFYRLNLIHIDRTGQDAGAFAKVLAAKELQRVLPAIS